MNADTSVQVVVHVWADCPDDMALGDFVKYLVELENPVIDIDDVNRRVLLATNAEA